MPLIPGTRLGAYEVSAQIGEGGMGQVYRATDTTLGRQVAIKILPGAFASDPERLARFEREAKTLAALNHPNIAAIYGFEESTDTKALVLELVEGTTLSDRLSAGPLSVAETLAYARQIVDALDAAHEKGIVHRDLKPANIRITPEGVLKVLDFGLAKARGDVLSADLSHSPTITVGGTCDGVILGTAAYMSPEQARGRPVDKRTDIWGFGCVLYEMLTGRVPFQGDTVSDTIAAILNREPDLSALPASLPPRVRELVERCFEKDVKRRLRDIGDARLELEEVTMLPTAETERVSVAPATRVAPWMLALMMIAAVAVAWSIGRWRSPKVTAAAVFPVRFAITAQPGEEVDITRSPVGVSQDGRAIAFAANRGGTQQIFVRDLDKTEATPIAGTEGGFAPFFSPDGQWVGFFANQKIRKVLRSGGAPVSIADFAELGATRNVSASWDEQDTILFTPDVSKGIWRVSASGGVPVAVTIPTAHESFHLWPQLLPDGRTILFSAIDDRPDPQAYVQRLDTGERTALVRGHGTRYVKSGHLVFVQGGSLMAAPFDLSKLQMTGAPISVTSDVAAPFRLRTMPPSFNRLFDVSQTGTLAFLSAGRPAQHALVWVDRSGREEPVGASGGTYAQPRVSPDGRRIAVVVRGDDFHDVWLYDSGRNTWERFTTEGNCEFPVWSADGASLAYNTDRTGPVTIEWKRTDGSGSPETIVSGDWARRSFPFSWSPDGQLAFVSLRPAQDIYVVRPRSGQTPKPFVATPFVEGAPMFAPDGRAIAYVSAETGRNEVYLRAFPGPGERVTVSSSGGNEPVWSPTGRELFYRVGDALMAVDVATTPKLTVGTPHRLFEKHYEPSISLYANYSTSDGQRFVMITRIDQGDAPVRINVAVNWTEGLKQAAAR